MSQATVPEPSISRRDFACPHCGAHATHYWADMRVRWCSEDHPTPLILNLTEIDELEESVGKTSDNSAREQQIKVVKHYRRLLEGRPFLGGDWNPDTEELNNVFMSRCHTCSNLAIWLHDRIIYPTTLVGPSANPDLSSSVLRDYEEARSILDLSPRGASALLRLAIEKICAEVGANGKTIDDKIADLVRKGLPLLVQQALDTVRVIGNEAVHPGKIDLRDDRDTAIKLFDLVNFIAQDIISRPKQIAGLYGMVPEEKRKYIEARNTKALKDSSPA